MLTKNRSTKPRSIRKSPQTIDMENCEQVTILGTLIVMGLVIGIFILYVENRKLKREIEQWDFKYFRLMRRINELEIY